jgi:hypothetical protein
VRIVVSVTHQQLNCNAAIVSYHEATAMLTTAYTCSACCHYKHCISHLDTAFLQVLLFTRRRLLKRAKLDVASTRRKRLTAAAAAAVAAAAAATAAAGGSSDAALLSPPTSPQGGSSTATSSSMGTDAAMIAAAAAAVARVHGGAAAGTSTSTGSSVSGAVRARSVMPKAAGSSISISSSISVSPSSGAARRGSMRGPAAAAAAAAAVSISEGADEDDSSTTTTTAAAAVPAEFVLPDHIRQSEDGCVLWVPLSDFVDTFRLVLSWLPTERLLGYMRVVERTACLLTSRGAVTSAEGYRTVVRSIMRKLMGGSNAAEEEAFESTYIDATEHFKAAEIRPVSCCYCHC